MSHNVTHGYGIGGEVLAEKDFQDLLWGRFDKLETQMATCIKDLETKMDDKFKNLDCKSNTERLVNVERGFINHVDGGKDDLQRKIWTGSIWKIVIAGLMLIIAAILAVKTLGG